MSKRKPLKAQKLYKAYNATCEDCSSEWNYWPQGLRHGCHLCGGDLTSLRVVFLPKPAPRPAREKGAKRGK